MLKRIFKFIVILIIGLILINISSCDVASEKIVIFVKGSRSMTYVFEKIAKAYNNSERSEPINLPEVVYGIIPDEKDNIVIPEFNRSKVEFIFLEGGSGRGIGSLLDGNRKGEIILSTRDLSATEIRTIENLNRTYIGNVIYLFKYAEDNIIPVVNIRNPRESISKMEIEDILEGRIKSWSDIYPFTENVDYIISPEGLRIDNSIQIALREPSSAIYSYLRALFQGVYTEELLEIASDEEIIEYVSKIYNSISFISSTYRPILTENGIKELTVTEAILDEKSKVLINTKPIQDQDSFLRKNCNIIFMKNQQPIEGLDELGKDITVDEIILDFINFSNSFKEKGIDDDKGMDISRAYFSFDFIKD